MIFSYVRNGHGLTQLPADAAVESAIWIDLYRPTPDEVVRIESLGLPVPSLEDM